MTVRAQRVWEGKAREALWEAGLRVVQKRVKRELK